MATSIFLNGRVIATPGSYSIIDASALEQVGVSATGIVGIVGTAVGGVPVSTSLETEDFIRINRPEKVRSIFRSGDLREAAAMLFEPSADAAILGGASEVICMKTNQALRASRTFSNADGTVLTVTSADYGEFTNQIQIEQVDDGANAKLVTVTLEDLIETAADVGGDALNPFEIEYEDSVGRGWDSVRASMLSTGLRVNARRREASLGAHVLVAITAGENVRVVSSAAGDTTQTVTVYGLDGSNNPQRETIALSGTTPVAGVLVWNAVYGAVLSAAAVGTVLVEEDAGGFPDLLSFAPAVLTQGLVLGSGMFVANSALSVVRSAAGTENVLIWGKNSVGATVSEKVVLTGTSFVLTTTLWSEIDVIVLGGVATAAFVGFSGVALSSSNSIQSNITKLASYVNARQVSATVGFTMTPLIGNLNFLIADMDLTSDVIPSTNADPTLIEVVGTTVMGTPLEFSANLKYLETFYDTQTTLVTAARIAFAPKIVDISITAAVATTAYTVTLDGFTVTYTSDASPTNAEIQAGLMAFINNHSALQGHVVASAGATAALIRITARTPNGFTLVESDANLTLVAVQSTAGAGRVPSDTVTPVFLNGGAEGTSTFTDFQVALNLLKKVRVNTIVVLTGDPAVHAAVNAHCAFMAGIGRNERDAIVGLSALDGNDDPTNVLPAKASIKSQVIDINSRHIRALAQSVDRFDTFGERTTFLPWFSAAVLAGMQAGSGVGEPMTHKFANVLDVRQDSSWNPLDDSEEMIQSGLCFLERTDAGRRVVRNITTWLQSNNIAFIEASVNQAVNFAAFEFRSGMETAVGKRGFAGTLNAASGTAKNLLSIILDAGAITTWRSLALELIVDVLEVSVEIAPVIPINFVKTTLHLVTQAQAA